MADSNFRGPVNSMGSLELQAATSASIEPFDGPSGFYQGMVMPDVHGGAFAKDGTAPSRVPAWMVSPDFITMDAVPQASSSTALAASQVITAATPMALATVAVTNFSASAASLAVGVPVRAYGTTTIQNLICLDFGFTTGTTIANSTVVNTPDNTLFQAGQWIAIGGVANAAGTATLLTQVQSASANGTSLFVSPMPATALGAPIGATDLFGAGLLPPASPFGPTTVTALTHSKTLAGGFYRVSNPREFLARNVVVVANTAVAGTATILVTGLDIHNNTVAELITASGTTITGGKKGFKYIISAVPVTITTTISASYTLGIGDRFSFPYRADEVPQLGIWAGATAIANNVGINTAVTSVATNTTGDVRGTVVVSAYDGGTPISNAATTNNVLRLYVQQSPSVFSLLNTTPNNFVPLFGVAQATA